MKHDLIQKVCVLLLNKGYTIKCLTASCFDVLARKEDRILLIKALEDANSISQEYADEMKKLSNYIAGSPIIISENAGIKLEENVVYSRFNRKRRKKH